jgi:uncharacterized membrane protein
MLRSCVIIGLGILLILPAFLSGFFTAHDLVFHLNWSRHFTEQFWSGNLYPRWLSEMNGGRGSPVFFFYGPIPYYFTSFIQPLVWNDPQRWLGLGLSSSLALILSGFSAFLWLEKFSERNAAFFASLVYMALPYHLVADTYLRFALAEFWAFVWMPLILYFTWQILLEKRTAIFKLAIVYALLVMTHLPTALLFSFLPIIYALIMAERGKKLGAFMFVALGMCMGIGLSAVYLIPALFNQQYVNISQMTIGRFSYESNFLISGLNHQLQGFHQTFSLISWMTIAAGILSLFCYIPFLIKRTKIKEGTFWFFCNLFVFFMMFSLSKPIWTLFPILQKTQFPYRFNVVLTLTTAALLAISLSLPRKLSDLKTGISFLLVGFLVFSQLLFSGLWVMKLATGTKNISSENRSEVIQRLNVNQGALEYIPHWAVQKNKDKILENKMDQILTRAAVEGGKGTVKVATWSPRHIVLATHGETDLQLVVNQFFYPGWVATLQGDGRPLLLHPDQEGVLSLLVPKGIQRVKIDLMASPAERLGWRVSLLSTMVLLCFWAFLLVQARVPSIHRL